jgi:predicted Zn-dependent protease
VLPGGYIFVPESLLLAARDEAEFAGMLAHAMAHATERHATRLMTRCEIATVANSSADGRTVPMSMLMFQREFEREADTLAVQIAAIAGFDPQALVRYIDRTQVDGRSKVFSSMPLRAERVQKMERSIATLPERTYAASDEFLEIQKQLRQ